MEIKKDIHNLLHNKDYQKQTVEDKIKTLDLAIEKEVEIQNNSDTASKEYRVSLVKEINYLERKKDYLEILEQII